MTTFLLERVIPFMNCVLAIVGFAVNLRAVKLGPPTHRRLRAAIASLCAMYAAAYAVLWTGIVAGAAERGYWSQTLATAGLISWPIVWIVPAVIEARQFQGALMAAGLKEKSDDRVGGRDWALDLGRGGSGGARHRGRPSGPGALHEASVRRAS